MQTQDQLWSCAFIADSATELKKHEAVSNKNEKVLVKRLELLYHSAMEPVCSSKTEKNFTTILAAAQKLKREEALSSSKVMKLDEINTGLKEELKTLQMQVVEKQSNVPILAEELESIKQKAKNISKDLNEDRKQHESRFRAILKAKDTYKKNLGCHLRLQKSEENGCVFVFSFDTTVQPAKSDTMPSKSVKFYYIPKENQWKLEDINPRLPQFERLMKKFEESQDKQGLLAFLKSALKRKR